MRRVGFVGTGHIAAPMARFLASRGHDVWVTRRNEAVSADLVRTAGCGAAEPQEVIDRSDVVILCLRPQHADPALSPLRFRSDQAVVSVMAGVSRAELEALCAPVVDFVQTIPLGYLEKGGCPLAAFGNHELLASLFAPDNPVVPVASEDALNAHFAICAMVPGILDLMQTGAEWLARQSGDSNRAEFYTGQLMSGFLASMDRTRPGILCAERDALATAGTLSLQMTEALRDDGAHAALSGALDTISKRLQGK